MKTEPAFTKREELREDPKSVFGVVNSRIQANRIVGHLANAGFDRDQISVLFPDAGNETPAPAGRTPGENAVKLGLAIGGAIGWLAGLDTLSVPGFGHLVAAGPLGAVLTGAAPRHGVKRALVCLGMRQDSARLYQDSVKDGQILICLQTKAWREAEAARKVFQAMGASNISIGGPRASGLLSRAFSRVTGRTEATAI